MTLTVSARSAVSVDVSSVRQGLGVLGASAPIGGSGAQITSGQSRAIDENSINGSNITPAISATGAPSFSNWSVSGTTAFGINASTGILNVIDEAQLDYEVNTSLSLLVSCQDDQSNVIGPVSVTVNLNPLNDNAPVFTAGASQSVNATENQVSTVATIAVTDPDAGTAFAWTLNGPDDALFTLDTSNNAAPQLITKAGHPSGSQSVSILCDDGAFQITQAINITTTAAGSTAWNATTNTSSAILSQIRIKTPHDYNDRRKVAIGFIAKKTGTILGSRAYNIWSTSSADTGYSEGDGGTHVRSIWTNSGTTPGAQIASASLPHITKKEGYWDEATARAKYGNASVVDWRPYGESGTGGAAFCRYDFQSGGVPVVAGEKYWLVFEAGNADWASHNSAIDMHRNHSQMLASQYPASYPGFDLSHEWVVKSEVGGSWQNDTNGRDHIGIIGLYYDDGDSFGNAFYQVPTSSNVGGDSDRARNVDGTKMVRQVINYPEARTIQEVGICAGRLPGGSSPITVKITQGGSTLLTTTLSGFPTLVSSPDVNEIYNNVGWRVASVADTVVAAGDFEVEVSTASGTDYEIASPKDASASYFQFGENRFGQMEYSDNNGSSWGAQSTALDMAYSIRGVM